MQGWIETYRGTVHRWELDNVDHFTVAYYFDRFADATANALKVLGLGATAARSAPPPPPPRPAAPGARRTAAPPTVPGRPRRAPSPRTATCATCTSSAREISTT